MPALKYARLAIAGAIVALTGLFAGSASGQSSPSWTLDAARPYAGFEQLTLSDGNAHGLAAIPAKDGARPVRFVWILVEGADVRFRLDGDTTPPTASIGFPIKNGADMHLAIDDATMANLRFIRQTAATVNVWVLYFY
jgi:hypothetical protein